ncbi:TonB-dependent receptor [Larkinella arboricola]
MKHLVTMLCLLLSGFCGWSQTQYTVRGKVSEEGRGTALAGVHVYVPEKMLGTTTNARGSFSLALSAQDSLTLVFSHVGYQTVQKTIPFQNDQELEIVLPIGQILEELNVRATPERAAESAQMSQIAVSAEEIAKIPALLGEKDVLRVLQLLPGVQKGSEGSTGIYVRGGGPDQNLILLDDAVIYNSGHLLGFFSAFNGSTVRNIELTKGGFPARFGGRLSSVIEVNTREGNSEKLAGEASVGLISSRLLLEGPLGKKKAGKSPATFLIAGRRTYVDLLSNLLTPSAQSQAVQSNTYFYDLNGRLNYTLGRKDKLFLSGYWGRDAFLNTQGSNGNPLQGSLNWRNSTATLRWNRVVSDQVLFNVSLIYNQYRLNVANEGRAELDTNGLRYSLRYRSGIRDLSLKYAVEFYPTNHQIRFGLQTTQHRFTPGAVVTAGDREPTSPGVFIDALESGLYGEDTWHPASRWRLNAGFRLSHFLMLQTGQLATDGKAMDQTNFPIPIIGLLMGLAPKNGRPVQYFRAEPRLSAAFQIDSSTAIKASYALMNQYAHLLSNNGMGLPADLWVPTTERIKPQQAQQFAVGLAKDFIHPTNPRRSLTLTLEGYYKRLENTISYAEGTSFLSTETSKAASPTPWENNITTGRGWSYGSEFFLQKKTGRLSGWIGYTLSWTWWQFPSLNGGAKFNPRYDRRHDASVVGIYEIKPGITLSWTWVYGTGQALTLPISRFTGYENRPTYPVGTGNPLQQLFGNGPNVKEYSGRNGFRAEPYHRLDVGARFFKQRKHYARTWEVGVYNLYNRRNPYYYSLEGKSQGPGKHSKSVLYKYSLFPVVPSVSYTIAF